MTVQILLEVNCFGVFFYPHSAFKSGPQQQTLKVLSKKNFYSNLYIKMKLQEGKTSHQKKCIWLMQKFLAFLKRSFTYINSWHQYLVFRLFF